MPGSIENRPYVPASSIQTLNSTFSGWGLFGTLLIFLVILIVALWIIRRLNRTALRGMDAGWARVLDRQLLGGQQALYLVEVGGKLQVLAGSDHSLVKLTEIDDPDLAAEILDEIVSRPADRVEGFLAGMGALLFRGRRSKLVQLKSDEPFAGELARMLGEEERR
ncbi:Flagellar biosynthesis protein, FliO [Acididesulfobacillus acetoxydans]|uniref:Flagellar biosynthesis protein, FliO n=1 Tax=Acididesulfobacillus acetoxydans TaxID=1561005 RepID=A0A8S0W5A2_9FIRM|nr:flagellar biosynthetic protein FliO [Acididesulfobacillus acetoxydans]CAA7602958.1 Flagellar biosynthesis protein, FliO [Acididesulfobacillus acetoxydans]CEJ05840.1 Flagellar biosynthesis protein, FliO [Acididesulfobacillus acetoxydans]